MSRFAVLIGEIGQELQNLNALVQRTEAIRIKAEATGDLDYLGTIALNLHGFYSGTERIFRDIALTVDETLPKQSDWHRQLLRQMNVAVPQIRPAVLSPEIMRSMNEFCSFRHVVRNVYTFDLIPERVQALALSLPEAYELLHRDLSAFCQFLATVNGSD